MTDYHPNVGFVLHLDLEKGALSPELRLNYNGFAGNLNRLSISARPTGVVSAVLVRL
jgi:hypothetical protein